MRIHLGCVVRCFCVMEPIHEFERIFDKHAKHPEMTTLTLQEELDNARNAVLASALRQARACACVDERAIVFVERSARVSNWIFRTAHGEVLPCPTHAEEDEKEANSSNVLYACRWMHVYLRSNPEMCFMRLRRRGRAFEMSHTLSYMQAVHEAYEKLRPLYDVTIDVDRFTDDQGTIPPAWVRGISHSLLTLAFAHLFNEPLPTGARPLSLVDSASHKTMDQEEEEEEAVAVDDAAPRTNICNPLFLCAGGSIFPPAPSLVPSPAGEDCSAPQRSREAIHNKAT